MLGLGACGLIIGGVWGRFTAVLCRFGVILVILWFWFWVLTCILAGFCVGRLVLFGIRMMVLVISVACLGV